MSGLLCRRQDWLTTNYERCAASDRTLEQRQDDAHKEKKNWEKKKKGRDLLINHRRQDRVVSSKAPKNWAYFSGSKKKVKWTPETSKKKAPDQQLDP